MDLVGGRCDISFYTFLYLLFRHEINDRNYDARCQKEKFAGSNRDTFGAYGCIQKAQNWNIYGKLKSFGYWKIWL